jgi:HlyD family secretion protein
MAVAVEDDRDFCYVGREQTVERRAVKVTQGSRDMLEVIDGLSEGEEVCLAPELFASHIGR